MTDSLLFSRFKIFPCGWFPAKEILPSWCCFAGHFLGALELRAITEPCRREVTVDARQSVDPIENSLILVRPHKQIVDGAL